MTKLYPAIPRVQPTKIVYTWVQTKREYRGPIPSADRSVICGPAWFCTPEHVVEGFDDPQQAQHGIPQPNRRFVMAAYCGAPDGIRCTRCNSQAADHDPGDEDPRCP